MDEASQGLLREFLQDQREGQAKTNAMLGDLRIDVAALGRASDAQGLALAEVRGEVREIGNRLRDAEIQLARVGQLAEAQARFDERLAGLHRAVEKKTGDLETRVRVLEGDGREHKVVSGAMTRGLGDIWRYVAAALVGAAVWMLANAARAAEVYGAMPIG
jgi:hypothetical protein